MSHTHQPVPEGMDPELWELAQKRASFKEHLVSFILFNGMMWIIWFISTWPTEGLKQEDGGIPWPIWSTVSWGIWLAFDFAEVYIFPEKNQVEREYQKLKNQKSI